MLFGNLKIFQTNLIRRKKIRTLHPTTLLLKKRTKSGKIKSKPILPERELQLQPETALLVERLSRLFCSCSTDVISDKFEVERSDLEEPESPNEGSFTFSEVNILSSEDELISLVPVSG